MTDIITERKLIEKEIKRLQGLLMIEKAKIRSLQNQCEHENEYTVSCMGEKGLYCPDCGRDF